MNELMLLLPVGVILGAALVVVLGDLALPHRERYILPWLALAGCILGLFAAGQTAIGDQIIWFYPGKRPDTALYNPIILGGAFCLDGFGMAIWALSCLAGALTILSSPPHSEDSVLSSGEYHGLILLSVAGMMLLGVSHDWLTLLISLEIMSISTYVLAGANRDDLRSNESALKYLVLGAFSTAFLLMGIAFYYGANGSVSLQPSEAFRTLPVGEKHLRDWFLLLGMGLVLVGAFFKIGAAPFHFWIPDVYQGAPTPVTGLMAFGVKAAAFAVIVRLCFEAFGASNLRVMWVPALLGASVLTMVLGNLMAMRQRNVKRMLAYSAIAHTGYLLLAMVVLPAYPQLAVLNAHSQSIIFYLVVYGVMTIGAFGVIGLTREDGKPLEDLDDFAGLSKENPGIALCMALFMLSLAGLPPLGGFFAKFMIFRDAIFEGAGGRYPALIVGAVIGILTSVASLYYYLKVVVAMYMTPVAGTEGHAEEGAPLAARCHPAWNVNLLIYLAGIVTLLLGIVPNIVLALMGK
ncbi:MAG TPA: NADH-quinone oxidoreductase subunit N [Planctomycetota bacterium]|jgi:NADH-quinone oxidoreductase subunit N